MKKEKREIQELIDLPNSILMKHTEVFRYFLFPFVFMDEISSFYSRIKRDYITYMKLMNDVAPFDSDKWCEEVKFFEKGVCHFFGTFMEYENILSKYSEKHEKSPESEEGVSIYIIVNNVEEDATEFLDNYVKFLNSVSSTFLFAHFCSSKADNNDEHLKIVFRYAATIGSVFENSSFKMGKNTELVEK